MGPKGVPRHKAYWLWLTVSRKVTLTWEQFEFSCLIEQLQISWSDYWRFGVEFTWVKELLWLRHRDNSGTHRKTNEHCWKPLPEDQWRDSTRRRLTCCSELCVRNNPWTVRLNRNYKCKSIINLVTNPNPTSTVSLPTHVTIFKMYKPTPAFLHCHTLYSNVW
jgi:hypothetical protein